MAVDSEVQIECLKRLRKNVVDARRSAAAGAATHPESAWDSLIKSIIDCQEAIRAIDEAIKDEQKLAGGNVDDFLKGASS